MEYKVLPWDQFMPDTLEETLNKLAMDGWNVVTYSEFGFILGRVIRKAGVTSLDASKR